MFQLLSMQHMREETDVCVGQLRQEVTSLQVFVLNQICYSKLLVYTFWIQEMLNEARHQAEGQVSEKEDELMRFKLDLSKHQKQVVKWHICFLTLFL